MMDERLWSIFGKRLRYSAEELDQFKKDPRNEDVIRKGTALADKWIVLEVVESHGCNSRHTVGEKIYFDAFGNLQTERSPKRICAYSLTSATMMIFCANEMLYEGIDPNRMRFRRSSCFDVGLGCGGWGRIVLELSVIDKEK